jgi:Spy/CpxP family protein refolding chaperone
MHFDSFKADSEAIYQCRHSSTKLNRKEEPCLFQVNPNYRIYADTVKKHTRYPYFVVSARPNATPVLTLNPIKHCSNEEYVQTCDAWQAVLQTLNHVKVELKLGKIPLNRIFVNFGKWMSQKDDDPNRRYCHAHINIVLTRGTIDTIHGMYLSKGGLWPFRSLVGSVLPPENYRLEDAWELMKYMNIPMTHDLVKDNHESKNTVGALKTNSEKLEHECKDLRQLISDSKFDGQKIEKLEHECKDLRQLISDSKFDGQKVEKLEHECKDLRQLISDSKFDGQKVEKLEHECKDLRQLISDRKYDGQKIEESTNIGYVSKIGRRINDVILIQEMQKYSDENWNRFLFPWNRI